MDHRCVLVQVCLAALMAQVGAWVPAQSLTLTPVDAIFVRMGAKDDVMSGQSTFFVELAETAAALNRATPASLVALDELGRGTATSDGAAIAAAVLEHLSAKTCCRCAVKRSQPESMAENCFLWDAIVLLPEGIQLAASTKQKVLSLLAK